MERANSFLYRYTLAGANSSYEREVDTVLITLAIEAV